MSSDAHGGLTLALLVVALVYLQSWVRRRVRRRGALPTALPMWRLAAFMGGMLSLWAAMGSPLAGLDHQFLTAHMVQHLLLMTVAAPLMLLGAQPFALPLARCSLVRDSLVQKLGRTVTHPVFCWLASTGTVIGWHVPALFELGLHSESWHAIEHASFFVAGLLFWWPVIQPWPSLARRPRWSVPLYLFLATLPCDALSAFLTFCNRVVYPHNLSAHRLFDISPLGDQECAGALMWVCVTFAYLAPAAVVTIQMLSPRWHSAKVEAA
jgi:putative membrane protein